MARKKIFLEYYSRQNFGDDLFVRVFAEYFRDDRIYLLSNPAYMPKGLGSNVHLSPFSWTSLAAGLLQSRIRIPSLNKFGQKLYAWSVACGQRLANASVMIGGSILKDVNKSTSEINFDLPADVHPDFSFRSHIQPGHASFIVGANLGPAFSETYFQSMKDRVRAYAHVCLRDYASYCKLQDCPNVQYAPDIVFAMPPRRNTPVEENVVISVMDIARYTSDRNVIESYYSLLASAIAAFRDRNIRVTLISFCKREGDEAGIDHLLCRIPNRDGIKVYCYNGDIDGMLAVFDQASFVIASRFHSLILAAVCGKPVFPISYSCKTKHYLQDLRFSGKYATFETLPDMRVDDIISNYQDAAVCDCETHHAHAANQFQALKQFLDAAAS